MSDRTLCVNCKFWDRNSENPQIGWCHAKSPQVFLLFVDQQRGPGYDAAFPTTAAGSWCGEGVVNILTKTH